MQRYRGITLKKGREKVLSRKHPWIFSRALNPQEDKIRAGEIVKIMDYKGKYLATGFYHPNNIALRIISYTDVAIDQNFWERKIVAAYQLRKKSNLPNNHTNCYRLFHGEGDNVSGLVIDIFGSTAVIQCHTEGIYLCIDDITEAVKTTIPEITHIYNKSQKLLPGTKVNDSYLYGEADQVKNIVVENQIKFKIDWLTGQKTGFFLDQRHNRQLLASYAKNKSILNCFSYTGGFSMYALLAGAKNVTSIDISQRALNTLEENLSINNLKKNHQTICGDVMQYLKEVDPYQFDIIVVDPPAFAKNISKKHKAVIAYKRLNALAINKVKKQGLIFTFSCSQVVDTSLFYNTIVAAAIEAGRNIRVLHKLSQGPDHPVNIFHPEGSYLKGLVLFVE